MQSILRIAAVAALLAAGAAGDTREPADPAGAPIVAMIREAVKAEDSGDPQAGRFYAPIQSITDVIAPFHWHGPDARDRWIEAVARDFETRDRTSGEIILADPTVARVEGSFGYFVFPAAFTFTQGDQKFTREVTITVTTTLTGGEWKIASWTWAGPN
jgi:hypothetical protein